MYSLSLQPFLHWSLPLLCHYPKMLMSFVSQNIIPSRVWLRSAFSAIDECCVLTPWPMVSMSHQVCLMLTVGVYAMGPGVPWPTLGACCDSPSVMETSSVTTDIPPLLQLSCTSTSINELVASTVESQFAIVPSVTICLLYLDPLQHPPHPFCRGSKVFITCKLHMTVLSFFGSATFMYLKKFPSGLWMKIKCP